MRLKISLFFICALLAFTPIHSFADTQVNQTGKNGWYEENGNSYYYQNNQLVKGWLSLNGNWFYLNKTDGTIYKGWLYDNGKWYFLGSNGIMQRGWLYDNKKWYFLDSNGAMKKGWLQYGGKSYFLNNNGAMQSGWLNLTGSWYYFANDGSMRTGWVFDSGKWYYLATNGVMQTGWLNQNNRKYYLNRTGAMQIGWLNLGGWYYFNASGSWVPNTIADQLTTISKNNQLILVTTSGYSTNIAKIRAFEKIDNKWYEKLNTNGFIGKDGFAVEMKEGAKKSPRGKYTIGTAFGRIQNPGTKLPYRQITSDDVWVDDSASSLYNTWQKASANNKRWNSAEQMNIPAYNYGFVINYNTEKRIPGAGSAIFFHVSNRYTLGCTGTAQTNVISILKWLDPEKYPVIIQTPESELGKY
ncbi:cell wall-binding protein [Neobacillus ginsengisoli]|uniref:Glucan-binding YG repeat protein n=1 Tax=Neobacillus ginsengisoli TaxID=904295 RepID=A0ABT9XQM6_9BACI|nr:cell wall-binding protein [Neobacillus ginsengisoli]MDQ0197855.1 glucan-binding YG repeat protein [Neobacillus ginsengisoli]